MANCVCVMTKILCSSYLAIAGEHRKCHATRSSMSRSSLSNSPFHFSSVFCSSRSIYHLFILINTILIVQTLMMLLLCMYIIHGPNKITLCLCLCLSMSLCARLHSHHSISGNTLFSSHHLSPLFSWCPLSCNQATRAGPDLLLPRF